MNRVICTLPNASPMINGVEFSPAPGGGMISAEIDAELVAAFIRIPGYSVAHHETPAAAEPEQGQAPASPVAPKAPAEPEQAEAQLPTEPAAAAGTPSNTDSSGAEAGGSEDTGEDEPASDKLAELRAQAEAMGIRVNNRWREARLQAEIDAKNGASA